MGSTFKITIQYLHRLLGKQVLPDDQHLDAAGQFRIECAELAVFGVSPDFAVAYDAEVLEIRLVVGGSRQYDSTDA